MNQKNSTKVSGLCDPVDYEQLTPIGIYFALRKLYSNVDEAVADYSLCSKSKERNYNK